ncbi:MAG: uracil-DNA glycosylase [Vicinamibacterales bacterium]
MTRDDLAAHLAFFADLGVAGVSTDPAWRARAVPDPVAPAAAPPPSPDVELAQAARAGSPDTRSVPVTVAPPAEAGSADTLLPLIRADIGEDCRRCKLHTLGRSRIVFGVGNPNADLMFVGEAPGADEDAQGIPFVGKAGQLLTKIIEAINLTRDEVYIANVIKCRPPGNRNPEPDEVEQCEPFLFRQIDAIRPKVIVALGKFAAQSLLRSAEPISKLRGREFPFRDAILMPTFHPAYLLRNPSSKREVWEDMKRVRELLAHRAGR